MRERAAGKLESTGEVDHTSPVVACHSTTPSVHGSEPTHTWRATLTQQSVLDALSRCRSYLDTSDSQVGHASPLICDK